MTDVQVKRATIIGTVAAVEIAFGVAEGIIMPNLFERKKGDPFFIPDKKQIVSIGATLLVTGVISGFLSEYVLDKWQVKDENRAKVITGVAVGVNVIETIITFNLGKKGFALPKMHEFAPAFAFLVFTSFLGGYASDSIIAAALPKEGESGSEPYLATI